MGLPWLTYAAMIAMVAVIVSMAFVKEVRSQLIPSPISLVVVLAAAWWRSRRAQGMEKVNMRSASMRA